MIRLTCAAALLLAASLALADSTATSQRTVTKLADGVYEIRHPDAPDTFPQSNTTVIIGDKEVLVVDTCLLPSTAREDIAQIRQWTNKPVAYIVNTHWHFDHTLGNGAYAEAFPAVRIINHTGTDRMVAGYNQGAVDRYPQREQRFRKILEEGKNPDGTKLSEAEITDYRKSIAGLGPVVAEFKGLKQRPADIVFEKGLKIDLGNRPVEIKFLGRGNTGGDTIVYLPKEKILATGDLVVHPVPYMFGGIPREFVGTLHSLAQIDAQTIVPGHGELLHDKSYIQQLIGMMDEVNAWVMQQTLNNAKLEDVQAAYAKALDVEKYRKQFAGDNQDDRGFFDTSFAGLVKASFNEAMLR